MLQNKLSLKISLKVLTKTDNGGCNESVTAWNVNCVCRIFFNKSMLMSIEDQEDAVVLRQLLPSARCQLGADCTERMKWPQSSPIRQRAVLLLNWARKRARLDCEKVRDANVIFANSKFISGGAAVFESPTDELSAAWIDMT